MKKKIFILIICLYMFLLTSCWDYREIDKLAFLTGAAIDRANTEKDYQITIEIINADRTGTKSNFKSNILSYKGKSIDDAVRSIISISAKQTYWTHATSIIVSEEIAREGLQPILDWLIRDSETRLDLYMIVSKDIPAKDILHLKPITTNIRSFEISDIIESSKKSSMTSRTKIYELINQISKKGINPVLPRVEKTINEGIETMKVNGGAVFKEDKLVGFLNEEEMKYHMFLMNKFDSGLFLFPLDEKKPNEDVTIELIHSKSKITPRLVDGRIEMKIKIKSETKITQMESNLDLLKEDNILLIKNLAEKNLEKKILEFICKTQNELNVDTCGFGEHIKGAMPKLWKEIEKDWDSIYKDVVVDLELDININETGNFSRMKSSK